MTATPGCRRLRLALGVLVAASVGCSSTSPAPAASPRGWTRPTPAGSGSTVVYVLRSDRRDPIVAATVPASIAGSASIGAVVGTLKPNDGHLGHLDGPAAKPTAPTGTGEQIILHDLAGPLLDGASFDLDISLASGRTEHIDVKVARNQPG